MSLAQDLAKARELNTLMFEAGEAVGREFAEVVGPHGLTPVQARTILLLEKPLPMGLVARHARCDASNITGLADRLEALGLVARVAADDRRVKLLELTEAGRALRRRLAADVARGAAVIARLDPDERDALAVLLRKLLVDPARAAAEADGAGRR